MSDNARIATLALEIHTITKQCREAGKPVEYAFLIEELFVRAAQAQQIICVEFVGAVSAMDRPHFPVEGSYAGDSPETSLLEECRAR